MDICLGVLKESDKSRFDSHNPGNSVLIISHITHNTFRDSRVHSFSDNLSRNSCKLENVESQDGDSNENLKKTIIALKQLKNNFAIACRSFVHCFVVTARIQLTFYGENFFWLLNWELFACQFFFNTNTGFHKKENKPFYLRDSCLSYRKIPKLSLSMDKPLQV